MMMMFLSLIKTNIAYADIDSSNNWGFGIEKVLEANRSYDYQGKVYGWNIGNEITDNSNTYSTNTKEVLVRIKYFNNYNINTYSNYYVSIDGNYIGNSGEQGILFDFKQIGNNYYTTVIIKNLTPGKHKIEVKADRPFNISNGASQKIDFIYVDIPAAEDQYILQSIEKIKNGTGTLDDYVTVGSGNVTNDNLQEVNKRIKGKNINASNVQATVNEILSEIVNEVKQKEIYQRINEGIGSLNDYTTIGISGITQNNLKQVNIVIKDARDGNKRDLTKDEIQIIVNDLPNKIQTSYSKINLGNAKLSDYNLVGVTGVTDIKLVDVNWYVKGKDNSTLSKLQSNVNTILNTLSYVNNGTTSISYYTALGISTVNSENIKPISASIVAAKKAKGNDLTKTEIEKAVVDTINNSVLAKERINKGEGKLEDYKLLTITGVTDINLIDVNWYVKGKDNSTLSKLQNNVNVVVNALSYINGGGAGISYYTTLGITTVTSDNLNPINATIKEAKKIKGNNLTKAEIEKVVVDTINNVSVSYEKINEGQATLDDYKLVGITNVTDLVLEDTNWYVKGKDNSTLSKLRNNVNVVVNALSYINSGSTGVNYYTTLGITTVNSNNIKPISVAVTNAKKAKGNNLTKAEIEKVVVDTINDSVLANEKINKGEGKLEDYTLLTMTGVNDINLIDVNWYVKGKDNSTLSKLQSNVNVVVNALSYINGGGAGISYYTTLGITTVTSDNLNPINTAIKEAKKAKGNNLTKAEIEKVVADTINNLNISYAKISEGQATIADYKLLGITNVTDLVLEDTNWYVKGKDNSTLSKLRNNVNVVVNALSYINSGSTGVNYYTILGFETVTVDNVKPISVAVVNAKKVKGSNLTKAEMQKVITDTIKIVNISYDKINKGEATLDDYKLLGITNVTDLILEDVNWYVKGKDNSTQNKLKTNVDAIVNALYHINIGNAGVSTYVTLGITTVTSDNFALVNKNVVIAKKAKGKDLTKIEIEKVVSDTTNNLTECYKRINIGEATLDDYKLVGITNVTDLLVEDVNWYVKGKDNSTLNKLKTNVDAIVNALYHINIGNAGVSAYTTLGITVVTSDNFILIDKNVVVAQKAKGKNLTKGEIEKVVRDTINTYANVALLELENDELIEDIKVEDIVQEEIKQPEIDKEVQEEVKIPEIDITTTVSDENKISDKSDLEDTNTPEVKDESIVEENKNIENSGVKEETKEESTSEENNKIQESEKSSQEETKNNELDSVIQKEENSENVA